MVLNDVRHTLRGRGEQEPDDENDDCQKVLLFPRVREHLPGDEHWDSQVYEAVDRTNCFGVLMQQAIKNRSQSRSGQSSDQVCQVGSVTMTVVSGN